MAARFASWRKECTSMRSWRQNCRHGGRPGVRAGGDRGRENRELFSTVC